MTRNVLVSTWNGCAQQWDALPTTSQADLAEELENTRYGTDNGTDEGDSFECSICICEYDDESVIRVLPCKHHFHKV